MNSSEITKELEQLKVQLQQKLDLTQSQLNSRDYEMGELKEKLDGVEKSLADICSKHASQVNNLLVFLCYMYTPAKQWNIVTIARQKEIKVMMML